MAVFGLHRRVTAVMTLALACLAGVCKAEPLPLAQYDVSVFDGGGELSRYEIAGMVTGSDGYLWVVSRGGDLFRFDGHRFDRQRFPDSDSVAGQAYAVARDVDGSLLVHANNGRLFRAQGRGSSLRWQAIANLPTVQILASPKWPAIVMTPEAFIRVRDGQAVGSRMPEWQPSTRLASVRADQDTGEIWMVSETERQIWRFDGVKMHIETLAASTEHARPFAIASRGPTRVLADYETGLRIWRAGQPPLTLDAYRHDIVRDLLIGPEDEVWVASLRQGLTRVVNGQIQRFTDNHVLHLADSRTLYLDPDQNLWIGTHNDGLVRLTTPILRRFDQVNGQAMGAVWSVVESSTGEIWLATNRNGFLRGGDRGFQSVPLPGKAPPIAFQVYPGLNGEVLLATFADGLYRWNGQRAEPIPALTGDHVPGHSMSTFVDPQGRILVQAIGTDRLLQLAHSTAQPELIDHHSVGLPSCVHHWPGHGVLIGTYGNGVYRLNEQDRLVQPAWAPDLASPKIAALHVSADQDVWVGHWHGGISWVRDGVVKVLGEQHGLPADSVFGILTDQRQDLWILTSRGLSRMRHQDLLAFRSGERAFVPVATAEHAAGLPPLDGAGGHPPSMWLSRDGTIWVATMRGVIAMQPDALPARMPLRPAQIDRVEIDGMLQQAGTLRLPWSFQYIDFNFSAPKLGSYGAMQFRHRLVGYDTSYRTSLRADPVSYSRLPAGTYRFEVDAGSADGIWLNQPAMIEFTVSQAWFRSWWFVLCVLTLMGLLSMLAVRFRLAVLNEKLAASKERDRIATELHDSLAQSLIAIRTRLELADATFEHRPAAAREALVVAMNLTATTVQDAYDSMWGLKGEGGPLLLDTAYLRMLGAAVFEHQHIVFEAINECPIPVVLPAFMHYELKMIVREALQNVMRHAEASRCTVRLTGDAEIVRIQIEDDGRGFDPAVITQPGALGISGMKRRATAIGAQIRIRSGRGQGARVSVQFRRPAMQSSLSPSDQSNEEVALT